MPVQGIASKGGSSSSLPQVLQDRGAQAIASQGGSSSSLPQVLQDRGAHEQRPFVVPPRDITRTTVASTSKLHIKDFATCLYALRRAAWPEAAAKSRSVISPHSEASGYWNFGCQVSRRTALTRVTLALPELCVALNGFLRLLFPQSSWNSICVAHNIVTAAHRDTANVEGSLIFRLAWASSPAVNFGWLMIRPPPSGISLLYSNKFLAGFFVQKRSQHRFQLMLGT